MHTTGPGGAEADREMHSIAKEEHAECAAALDELRLDLTSLLLPRCGASNRVRDKTINRRLLPASSSSR